MNSTEIKSLLAQLRGLLEDDDADAVDKLRDLLVNTESAILLQKLTKVIGQYDFEYTLEYMQEIEQNNILNVI